MIAGRRAARHALSLVIDLHGRLDAAGVPPSLMPDLGDAVDLVSPLALELARRERAGKSARRRHAAVMEGLAARWTEATRCRFAEFDPAAWHVELRPGPAPDHAREAA